MMTCGQEHVLRIARFALRLRRGFAAAGEAGIGGVDDQNLTQALSNLEVQGDYRSDEKRSCCFDRAIAPFRPLRHIHYQGAWK